MTKTLILSSTPPSTIIAHIHSDLACILQSWVSHCWKTLLVRTLTGLYQPSAVCEADELPGGSEGPPGSGRLPGPGQHPAGREGGVPRRGAAPHAGARGQWWPGKLQLRWGHERPVHRRWWKGRQWWVLRHHKGRRSRELCILRLIVKTSSIPIVQDSFIVSVRQHITCSGLTSSSPLEWLYIILSPTVFHRKSCLDISIKSHHSLLQKSVLWELHLIDVLPGKSPNNKNKKHPSFFHIKPLISPPPFLFFPQCICWRRPSKGWQPQPRGYATSSPGSVCCEWPIHTGTGFDQWLQLLFMAPHFSQPGASALRAVPCCLLSHCMSHHCPELCCPLNSTME